MTGKRTEIFSSGFRCDIQVLRAIAVLSVVLFHDGLSFFAGGFIGVDVFFVISGYLISGILLNELARKGSIDFLNFYARRIRRLLPAFLVVFLFSLFVIFIYYPPIFQKQYLLSALYSILYSSNILFAINEHDYLGNEIDSDLFLHTWSLSTEEQFYLFWPIFLVALFKLHSPADGNKNKYRFILTGISIACIISFSSSILFIREYQPWVFFGTPFRIWEFCFGAIAYHIHTKALSFNILLNKIGIFFGFALIFFSIFYFDKNMLYPGYYALIPVFGTFLVLVSGDTATKSYSDIIFHNTFLLTLGNLSYSWYLWHWPIQILFSNSDYFNNATEIILSPLISLALAYLTYVSIEQKTRYSPFLLTSPKNTFSAGLFFVACSILLTNGYRHAIENDQSSKNKTIDMALNSIPRTYRDKCHLGYTSSDFGKCAYGKTNTSKSIFLLGDSHAAHWFPALEKIASEEDYRLIAITKAACPTVMIPVRLSRSKSRYTSCDKWREKIIGRALLENPDIIIISNSSYYRELFDNPSAWENSLLEFINKINNENSKVFLLQDTPRARVKIPQCLSAANWQGKSGGNACSFIKDHKKEDVLLDIYEHLQNDISNITLVKTENSFCKNDQCEALDDNGIIVYRDSHHMTIEKSLSLVPILKEQIVNRESKWTSQTFAIDQSRPSR